ncbi:copper transport protein ATX1-like [Apium graveolens]|uniref:copper transport protein ATX1-like n=1 Tax=Apium graveolens TaxID=4045 RepID=UPI003D7A9B9C
MPEAQPHPFVIVYLYCNRSAINIYTPPTFGPLSHSLPLVSPSSNYSCKGKTKVERHKKYTMANVVELKVGLHCDECIKKILKAVKKIEDIETYDVDTQLNKIKVTGKVTTEEVMKALQKIGKQSTIWEDLQ